MPKVWRFVSLSDDHLKMGSQSFRSGAILVNGLRHPPEGDTNGWQAFRSERNSLQSSGFFVPHAHHLVK